MDLERLRDALATSSAPDDVVSLLGGDAGPLADEEIRSWFASHPEILANLVVARLDHHADEVLAAVRQAKEGAGAEIARRIGDSFEPRIGLCALALSRGAGAEPAMDAEGVARLLSRAAGPLNATSALAMATWLARLSAEHRLALVCALAQNKPRVCRYLSRGISAEGEAEAVWPVTRPKDDRPSWGVLRRCAELAPTRVIADFDDLSKKARGVVLDALAVSSTTEGATFAFERLATLSASSLRQAMHRSRHFRELVLQQTPKKKSDRLARDELTALWERRDPAVAASEARAEALRAELDESTRDRIVDELLCGALVDPARVFALRDELGDAVLAEIAWQVRQAAFYREPLKDLQPLWEALGTCAPSELVDHLRGISTAMAVVDCPGWQTQLGEGAWRALADWQRWDLYGIGALATVRVVGAGSDERSIDNVAGDFPAAAAPWLCEALRRANKAQAPLIAGALSRLGDAAIAALACRLDLPGYAITLAPVAAAIGDGSLREPMEKLLATKPAKKVAQPLTEALKALS
jgi:hypothetical protein